MFIRITVFCLLLLCLTQSYAKVQVVVFTKNGKQYILEDESKKENSILISTSFNYKGTKINISDIDSVRIEDALYKTIFYKSSFYMARLLFSGTTEGYKIHYKGEKIIVIKNTLKDEYVPVTKTNKVGAYNYLFPDCFKKDSNLYKIKSNTNDDNITKEITKTINCQNKPYIIYKKPAIIDVYIAPVGGLILYNPKIKSDLKVNLFNYAKIKPLPGYTAGGRVGFILNNKLDIGVYIGYAFGRAGLSAKRTTEYYTIKDTTVYAGNLYSKSVDISIDFKYLFLKSKLSPVISGGLFFSAKLDNHLDYQYTNDNGATYVYNQVEYLAARVMGLNLGLGLYYRPVKKVSLFIDAGYRIGVGLISSYRINEGMFYANMGIGVKLNK